MKSDFIPLRRHPFDCSGDLHLIDQVSQLRHCVGDGLNDAEFTQLLLKSLKCEADGFSILCFSDGAVTFGVPKQDLDLWYPTDHWIAAEKEEIARAAAEKFDLSLCEPPDRLSYIVPPPRAHHHLELITRWETVAVAHPFYLKIRVFSGRGASRMMWTHHTTLPSGAAVMQELIALYR